MGVMSTEEVAATERGVIDRALRRGMFGAVLLIIGGLVVLTALFITSLGSAIAPAISYLIVPLSGFAVVAANWRARPLPCLLAVVTFSLVAAGVITRDPNVKVLMLTLPTGAFFAAALVLSIVTLRRGRADARVMLHMLALVLVVALLFAPLADRVRFVQQVGHEDIVDVRMGGTEHAKALDSYGADFAPIMQLIREKAPESATIALPNHYTFPIEGNGGLVNYFAYPRALTSQSASRTPVFDISGASYILGVAQNNQNVWPLFAVPVRLYYHAPARHEITFGAIALRAGGKNVTIAPSDLQPWQTDADRTLESDVAEPDGTRTVTMIMTGSVTDPWMAAVAMPLATDTAVSVPVQTNGGAGRVLTEQVALLVEVRGPGGETALFASRPAPQTTDLHLLTLPDLASRAAEYARARGWQSGPLTITRIGLEMGWQLPLRQTKTDVLVAIERGQLAPPEGPDSFARLAYDAQRQILAGNPNAAVDRYAAALLLRPDDYDGQLALGEAFAAAGRWQDGGRYFAALLGDHPVDPWIRYRLATMQRETGDRKAAQLTLAPLIFTTPVAHIARPADAAKPGTRAQLIATPAPRVDGAGYRTPVTLAYDTGDDSDGRVIVTTTDGSETVVAAGKRGTVTVEDPGKPTTLTYRLSGGAAGTTPLGAVTIEYLNRTIGAPYTLWANLLWAQLTAELGDRAGAAALYRSIAATDPLGEFGAMARTALQHLDGAANP